MRKFLLKKRDKFLSVKLNFPSLDPILLKLYSLISFILVVCARKRSLLSKKKRYK